MLTRSTNFWMSISKPQRDGSEDLIALKIFLKRVGFLRGDLEI